MLGDKRYLRDARLPPERELAEQLGISRRALRDGLERLEAAGKIWRHVGKGTFVGSRPLAEPGAAWASLASNPVEVMEVRLEIEPTLAALAAVRALPAEVQYIEHCLRRSKSAADLETFEAWDTTMHRAIAEAAHNSLLLAIFEAINIARRQTFWGDLQSTAIDRCGLDHIWLQHAACVDAIARRDAAGARHFMQQHIVQVRDSMFNEPTKVPATRGPSRKDGTGKTIRTEVS
jgi:DNA-binding FadR family transcriptional regulator